MIIGLSSKISGGKDTVAKIIQYLVAQSKIDYDLPYTLYEYLEGKDVYNVNYVKEYKESISEDSGWQNKKFAGKLKEIVCILLGCTLQQLENREFKEKELGEEWWYYQLYGREDPLSYLENKDEYDFDDLYKPTVRSILQNVGTDLFRHRLHKDTWINALMNEYVYKKINIQKSISKDIPDLFDKKYPNWIISDLRFPNELKAIKDRKGITIRVNRFQESDVVLYEKEKYTIIHIKGDNVLLEDSENKIIDTWVENIKLYRPNEHESEKSLDNAKFDYVIYNIGTIEDLVEKVKQILIKENIL